METKLWYLVIDSDKNLKYEKLTLDEALEIQVFSDKDIHIVHPENKMLPEEYRNYNNEYRDLITEIRVDRLKRLINVGAPAITIALEADIGPFTRYFNPLENTKNDN